MSFPCLWYPRTFRSPVAVPGYMPTVQPLTKPCLSQGCSAGPPEPRRWNSWFQSDNGATERASSFHWWSGAWIWAIPRKPDASRQWHALNTFRAPCGNNDSIREYPFQTHHSQYSTSTPVPEAHSFPLCQAVLRMPLQNWTSRVAGIQATIPSAFPR